MWFEILCEDLKTVLRRHSISIMNNLVSVIEELQSPLNDIRSKAEKVKSIIRFM